MQLKDTFLNLLNGQTRKHQGISQKMQKKFQKN